MVRTTTVGQRIGAGFLVVLMLVLMNAAILAACPAGCCDSDDALTIGRVMPCCEMPSVEEREPASAAPARAASVNVAGPHVALPELVNGVDRDVQIPAGTYTTDGGGHRRLHTPLFLANAQFLI